MYTHVAQHALKKLVPLCTTLHYLSAQEAYKARSRRDHDKQDAWYGRRKPSSHEVLGKSQGRMQASNIQRFHISDERLSRQHVSGIKYHIYSICVFHEAFDSTRSRYIDEGLLSVVVSRLFGPLFHFYTYTVRSCVGNWEYTRM